MIRIRNPVGVAQGPDLDRHQSERKGRIRIRIKVSGSATLPLQGREGKGSVVKMTDTGAPFFCEESLRHVPVQYKHVKKTEIVYFFL
jgi:hypothetical protein